MATPEQKQSLLAQVDELLERLTNIDPEKLARRDISSKINFQDAVPEFKKLLSLCKQLRERNLDLLAYPQLTQVHAACNSIAGLVSQVESFDINQNTPGTVCENITTSVKNAYDDILNLLTLPLAFTATQETDYSRLEREAKGYYQTMKEEANSFKSGMESYQKQAESALDAVKGVAAEAGVSSNAQVFAEESIEFGNSAQQWLNWTIGIAVLTLLVTVAFFIAGLKHDPGSTAKTIQYVFGKLVVLSALSFVLFWCSKNYRSNKHNETLNKHRANALRTFKAFVEGSEDPEIKDTVLTLAASAAFSPRPSGFETAERDAVSMNPIVDVIGRSIKSAGPIQS